MRGDGHLLRDGRELLDLSSNDYLGLAQHPAAGGASANYVRAIRRRLGRISAHYRHQRDSIWRSKRRSLRFKGSEAALIFATGWQANAAAIFRRWPRPRRHGDFRRPPHPQFHPRRPARRIGGCPFLRHNDFDHLARLLAEQGRSARALVVTESVFSMDGDRADLARLNALAPEHDAYSDRRRSPCHRRAGRARGRALGGLSPFRGRRAHRDGHLQQGAGRVRRLCRLPRMWCAIT